MQGIYGHEQEAVVPSHSRRILHDTTYRQAHRKRMMSSAVWRALREEVVKRPKDRIKLVELMPRIERKTKFIAADYQQKGVDKWLASNELFSLTRPKNENPDFRPPNFISDPMQNIVSLLSSHAAESLLQNRLERVRRTDNESGFHDGQPEVLSPYSVRDKTKKRKMKHIHYHELDFNEQCFHFLCSEREFFSATYLYSFRENLAEAYTRIFNDVKDPMREVWRKRIESFPDFMTERMRLRRESDFSTPTYFIPSVTWSGDRLVYTEEDTPPPPPSPDNLSYDYDSDGQVACPNEMPKINLENLTINEFPHCTETGDTHISADPNSTRIMENGGCNYDLPVIGTPCKPGEARVQPAEEQRRSRSTQPSAATGGYAAHAGVPAQRSRSEHPSAAGFPRQAFAEPRRSPFPSTTAVDDQNARNRSMSAVGGVSGARRVAQQQRETPRLQPIPQQPGAPFRSATALLWSSSFNPKKVSPLVVAKAPNPPATQQVATQQSVNGAPVVQPVSASVARPAPPPAVTPAPRAVTPSRTSWSMSPTAEPVPGPWGHTPPPPVSHGTLTPIPVMNGPPSRFAVTSVASTPAAAVSARAPIRPLMSLDVSEAPMAPRPVPAAAMPTHRVLEPLPAAPVASSRPAVAPVASNGRGYPAVAPVDSSKPEIVVRIERGGWPTPLPDSFASRPATGNCPSRNAALPPRHPSAAVGNPSRPVTPSASRRTFGRQARDVASTAALSMPSSSAVYSGSVFDAPASQRIPAVPRSQPMPAPNRSAANSGDDSIMFGVPKSRILQVTVNFLAKAHPAIITDVDLEEEYNRELYSGDDYTVSLEIFTRECLLYLQELDIFRIVEGHDRGATTIEIADLDEFSETMSELNVPALAEAQMRVWIAETVVACLRNAPNQESTRQNLDTELTPDLFDDLPRRFPHLFIRKRPGVIGLAPGAPRCQ